MLLSLANELTSTVGIVHALVNVARIIASNVADSPKDRRCTAVTLIQCKWSAPISPLEINK